MGWNESRYSPVLCDGVTIEVSPLEKGVRGIFNHFFPLNSPLLDAGPLLGRGEEIPCG